MNIERPPGSREDCWNDVGVAGSGTCPVLTVVSHCRSCPVLLTAGSKLFEREPPDDYLVEWTEVLARPEETREEECVSLVLFRLGAEWLALPTEVVSEVTPLPPVHRVPHRSGKVFRGIVSIRGELHLCASFHGLLHVDEEEFPPASEDSFTRQAPPRMMVIERSGQRWALPVDEMHGTHRVSAGGGGQWGAAPQRGAPTSRSFTRALVQWQGWSVGVLDDELVFSALARSLQ
ncbi:MAG: chemotaxis protein CheW [Planctomycetota bacterium]